MLFYMIYPLLFRHCAKNSIAQEEYAIVVRLHAHSVSVVILTPGTADIADALRSSLTFSVVFFYAG